MTALSLFGNLFQVPKTSPAPSPSQKDTPKTEKAGTTTLEFTDRFTAQPSDIYEALMDPRRVEAYTQSSVQMECIEGGKFSLFSGNVTGEYIKLQQNHKIVEKWRLSSWPEGDPLHPHPPVLVGCLIDWTVLTSIVCNYL